MRKWIKLLAAACVLALLLTAAGCNAKKNEKAPDNSLQRVLDAGQLILGLDVEFPPMGFLDENGEIVGFDIDVAREVCRRLGIELATQPINWDSKVGELNSGLIDCIWNGMSADTSSYGSMCLSEPYMNNELILVVTGSSDVMDLEGLAGKTVGAQSGSTALKALEAAAHTGEMNIRLFLDNPTLLRNLEQGTVDAAVMDSVCAYYYILSSDETFFVLPDILGEDEYVIGFRKDDVALRDRIQEILVDMKTDGTLGEISTKWFGSDITTVR